MQASLAQRRHETARTRVKQISEGKPTCVSIPDMLERLGRQIPDEDLRTEGWLLTKLLWNVADREVDWIGGFISEESELGLVGRNDDRDYCGAWTLALELNLKILCIRLVYVRIKPEMIHLRTPPPSTCVHIEV